MHAARVWRAVSLLLVNVVSDVNHEVYRFAGHRSAVGLQRRLSLTATFRVGESTYVEVPERQVGTAVNREADVRNLVVILLRDRLKGADRRSVVRRSTIGEPTVRRGVSAVIAAGLPDSLVVIFLPGLQAECFDLGRVVDLG